MTWLEIAGITLYSTIGVLSCILFMLWLHDVKPHKLSIGLVGTCVIAASLALVWPLSLFGLYAYEKKSEEAIDELDDCGEEA